MATIDYKQKIKDYMNSSEVDTLYKSMLNNLFPELAESEDKRIRKAIVNIIGDIDGGFKFEKYGILKKDALAWLKKGTNGNEREIPNSDWSEEDESRIDNLCHFLEEYGNQYYGHLTLQCTISWLKSFKDRYNWKPSKEQMEYLHKYAEQNNYDGAILTSLYNDLKHLKQL